MTSSKKRSFPNLKSDKDGNRFTRKDELHNEVAKIFRERKFDFHDSKVSTDGDYCVSVITNVLWYITNDHNTINNACKHTHGIIPIPMAFEHYDGYNDVKRKKRPFRWTKAPCIHMRRHFTAFYFGHLRQPDHGNP